MNFTQEELAAMKEEYVSALVETGRSGVSDLIAWLDESGFFTAPCSTQYHLACEGGLLRHSLNVNKTIHDIEVILNVSNQVKVNYHSMTLVALLHDIGKCGMYGKPNYIENILKSGKRSDSKPYTTNPDLLYLPHALRSVEIASKFIQLTEDEEFAIACHDGLYGEMKYVIQGHETPLYLLLHSADMFCSRLFENERDEESE